MWPVAYRAAPDHSNEPLTPATGSDEGRRVSLRCCHSLLSCPVRGVASHNGKERVMDARLSLHLLGVVAGGVLALAPALLPSARPTRRWPHVVMALGMAAGHLGGL